MPLSLSKPLLALHLLSHCHSRVYYSSEEVALGKINLVSFWIIHLMMKANKYCCKLTFQFWKDLSMEINVYRFSCPHVSVFFFFFWDPMACSYKMCCPFLVTILWFSLYLNICLRTYFLMPITTLRGLCHFHHIIFIKGAFFWSILHSILDVHKELRFKVIKKKKTERIQLIYE